MATTPARRAAPPSALRPISETIGGYRRLSHALGVSPSTLALFGVDPGATVASAERVIRDSVGPRAWRSMAAATSIPARSSAAINGLRAMRAADREPVEPALRRATGNDEPADPPCAACGHAAAEHPGGASCSGCRCPSYQGEPADDREHATAPAKPAADPKRSAMIDRIVASTGSTRERVAASMSAVLGASRPRPVALDTGRAASRAAGITDDDRKLAAAHGYDPADVARSRAALFGGAK